MRHRALSIAYLSSTVLFLLIPAVWLALVLFGLTMCRLGARSDRDHAEALERWITVGGLTDTAPTPDTPAQQLARELPGEGYRATG